MPANSFTEDEANAVLAEFGDTEGEKFQEATLPNGDQVLRISGQVTDVEEGTKIAERAGRGGQPRARATSRSTRSARRGVTTSPGRPGTR